MSLFFGCALLVFVSPCAFAQDESGSQRIIIKVDDEGSTKTETAYLGVLIEDITKRIIDEYDYPRETGVIITKVVEGSAAEKAGLEEDDIVYLFGGTKVEEASQLTELVRKRKPGDKVTVVIYRDGTEKKVPVVLGKHLAISIVTDDFGKLSDEMSKKMGDLTMSTSKLAKIYSEAFVLKGRLGMALEDLNDDLAGYFSVRKGDGVLVLDVEEDSPASRAGVRSGDVITKVDGEAVSSTGDFLESLSAFEPGDTVAMELLRKGAKKSIELEIEEGLNPYQFYVAPFDRSGAGKESVDRFIRKEKNEEASKLREEMQTLKERLRELEERLGDVERKK